MPQVSCPNGHRLQISDRHTGQVITCPTCHTSFVAQPDDGMMPPTPGPEIVSPGMPAPSSRKGLLGGVALGALINRFVGKPLLFLGLILVVLGRGCDSTSMRSVARTDAYYRQARDTFQLEWDAKSSVAKQKVDKKNREINDLQSEKGGDPDTQKKVNEMQKERDSLQKDLNKVQQERDTTKVEKDNSDWKPLREASIKATSNHQMAVYWHEWVFIFGTVVLVLGILTLAFTGEGAERWIAYIMIAIITFSIYVGGAAWIESVISSVSSSAPRAEKF